MTAPLDAVRPPGLQPDPAPAQGTPAGDSALALLEKATQAGLWHLDLTSGDLRGSPRLAALLGRWPRRLDFLAPDWRAHVQACVHACAQQGLSFDCEAQVITAEGQLLWVRLLGQALRNCEGHIQGIDGAIQAICPRAVMTDALLTVDGEGRLTYLNAQAQRLLGRSALSLQGRSVWGLFQKTARLQLEAQVRQALASGGPLEIEALDTRQSQWLQLRGERFANGLTLQLRDVTTRRQSEEQLRLLEGSIARLNDLIIITEAGPFNEPGPRIVFVNEAFEARTGYSRQEVLGRSPRLLQGPQTQRDRLAQIRSALERWQPVRVDLINYRRDAVPFWVDLDISPVWDKSRQLTHWVAVGRDVTERKAVERKIRHLAFCDALTGLPNRQRLLDRLQRSAGAPGGALMFIDLDNFKALNDTLGHQQGDQLLQQVAARLRVCVAAEDMVARLGGDEFVVLLQPPTDPQAAVRTAAAVADRILRALGEPYQLPAGLHHSTCSMGVTVFGSQQVTVSELLKQADLAMYQAKRAGRNAVCFFDPQMQALASAHALLAADLRQACCEGQFLLDYQPQVDPQGRVCGVEALLRWTHPVRGRVPPAQFIATAEETSLILEIGRWVLEQACAQLALWARRPDRSHLCIAINVSARQFRDPQWVDQVTQAIARAQISPSRLKLELTESLLADDIEITVAKMKNLRAMGVGLALDDFGMGYSSLSYLKRLPLSQLKIDREFVKDLLNDANDAAIARTIIRLAQSLQLEVIAEGVETPAQRDFLLQQGCQQLQGFLFCAPLPIDALEAYLDRSSQ
jgi:diguanylate cyclase (GGDEF)-like protein/PAS domain S-box-containing protein